MDHKHSFKHIYNSVFMMHIRFLLFYIFDASNSLDVHDDFIRQFICLIY